MRMRRAIDELRSSRMRTWHGDSSMKCLLTAMTFVELRTMTTTTMMTMMRPTKPEPALVSVSHPDELPASTMSIAGAAAADTRRCRRQSLMPPWAGHTRGKRRIHQRTVPDMKGAGM
jgi:hypothetical protein